MPKKSKDIQFYEAIGRRKEAVARVRLYIVGKSPVTIKSEKYTKGAYLINEMPLEKRFAVAHDKKMCLLPLVVTDSSERFVVSVSVTGGGPNGQLEAIRHGLARALVMVDESYKPKLREYSLLTRDSRIRQRRQVGTGGKARRQKQSPKR